MKKFRWMVFLAAGIIFISGCGENVVAKEKIICSEENLPGRAKPDEMEKGAIDVRRRHGTTSGKLPGKLTQIPAGYCLSSL